MKFPMVSQTLTALEVGAIAMVVLWLLAMLSGYTFDGTVHIFLWLAVLAVLLRFIWRIPKPPHCPREFSDGSGRKINGVN